jgi:hypothetical protein
MLQFSTEGSTNSTTRIHIFTHNTDDSGNTTLCTAGLPQALGTQTSALTHNHQTLCCLQLQSNAAVTSGHWHLQLQTSGAAHTQGHCTCSVLLDSAIGSSTQLYDSQLVISTTNSYQHTATVYNFPPHIFSRYISSAGSPAYTSPTLS